MPTAWVALGSNVGHRGQALGMLRAELATGGVEISAASSEVVTKPVGVTAQADFLNQVLRLDSRPALEPLAWLGHCRRAETAAGRRPTWRWGPRRADVDVLLLGEDGSVRVELPELTVPHPELGARPFLWPLLTEIAPELRHPDGWRPSDRTAGTN